MVSTTGEHARLLSCWTRSCGRSSSELPAALAQLVERIGENCEPALVHGAVHGRRRRLAARRRHRKPGAADALGQGRADDGDLRRRAGLCLAGRRHHLHGRRDAHAGQRLRLRADAGARGADRVHHAARRLCGARRPHGRRSGRSRLQGSPTSSAGRCRIAPTIPGRCARRRGRCADEGAPQIACCPTAAACICRTGRSTSSSRPMAARDAVRRPPIGAAARASTTVLDELCGELPLLRAAGAAAPAALRRAGRAPHARRGGALRGRGFHHADGGGGRRGGRGDPGRDDCRRRRSTAPMSTMAATSRCTSRPANASRIGMVDRPDRPGLFGHGA